MGKVVQFRKGDPGWLEGVGKCIVCGYEIEQVVSLDGPFFTECPECHCMKMVMKFPVERDIPHWQCACGNWYFSVTHDGYYCPNCGQWQTGF